MGPRELDMHFRIHLYGAPTLFGPSMDGKGDNNPHATRVLIYTEDEAKKMSVSRNATALLHKTNSYKKSTGSYNECGVEGDRFNTLSLDDVVR